MKFYNLTCCFIAIIISVASSAQSFQIGSRSVTYTDASRANRAIATEVYYPATTAGSNVAVANGTQKFPVIVFGHGFVMTWDAYQNIWEALVPQGYIVAFPKTEGTISPSHTEFGKDLAFLIGQINSEGQNSSSFLFNRVDTMNCVMGHSMGGGAAFLSPQYNTQIKTIATLAAAETNPSSTTAAGTISKPALVFAGANDCVAAPATNQLQMYTALVSTCKTYISIIGGSHCQFANSSITCSFGESTCTPAPTITRMVQQSIVNSFLLPWLNYQLKGDCPQGATFDNLITTSSSITFQKNCTLCNSVSAADIVLNKNTFALYPNPVKNTLTIDYPTFSGSSKIIITTILGEIIYQTFNSTNVKTIDISAFEKGVYFLSINSITKRFVKE